MHKPLPLNHMRPMEGNDPKEAKTFFSGEAHTRVILKEDCLLDRKVFTLIDR